MTALLSPTGQPETILTLDYGYMLVSTNPTEPVLIFGRNGSRAIEEVAMDDISSLREFVAPIKEAALKAGGRMQLIHFAPHAENVPGMKVAAGLRAMNLRGDYLIQIVPLPLDMPLDSDGQLSYDFEPFEAAFASRFAVKH